MTSKVFGRDNLVVMWILVLISVMPSSPVRAQAEANGDALAARRAENLRKNEELEQARPGMNAFLKQLGASELAGIGRFAGMTPTRPELREQLLSMANSDQLVRRDLAEAFRTSGGHPPGSAHLAVVDVDAKNRPQLEAIIAHDGFPTAQMVGTDGTHAAFLLVQHATANTEFQSTLLPLMKPRVASGDIRADEFALLTDRVRLREGQAQLYGTQWHISDGHRVLLPVEDAEHLDARRAEVGLPPIALEACTDEHLSGLPTDISALASTSAAPSSTP